MKSMQWPVLGLTRFILALIVASSHLGWFTFPADPARLIGKLSGLVAVLGFLVISGYSIAASFERDAAEFYYRRALRILPLYVLLTVASAVVPIVLWQSRFIGHLIHEEPTYSQLCLNLCFTPGFISTSLATNPVLWTLALEVFFYACTPLLARCSNRGLLALAGLGAVSYVVTGRLVSLHYPTVLWGLNVGLLGWTWVLGFWVYRAKGRAIEVAWLIGLVALTLNHAGLEDWWMCTWTIPMLALKLGPRLRWSERLSREFLLLGDISYPLYLLHFPVYLALIGMTFPPRGIYLLGTALVLATLLDRFYDRPVKQFVNRLRIRIRPVSRATQDRFTPAEMAASR